MARMRNRIIQFTVLLLVLSCSKPADLMEPVIPDRLLLNEVMQTEYIDDEPGEFEIVESFQFDELDRIRSMQRFEPEYLIRWELGYDEIGKASTMVIYRNDQKYQHVEFIYEGDRVSLARTYSELTGTLIFEDRFYYDALGLMESYERASEIGRELRAFTWFEGNVVRIEVSYGGLAYVHEYEYDFMINPYRAIFEQIGFDLIHRWPVMMNNQVAERAYRSIDHKQVAEINAEYSYRQPGYPYYARIKSENDLGQTQDVARVLEYYAASSN